ncbi:MAG: hypothetical protein ACRED9_07615 [Caulobacteraceae bacterium]
MTTLEHARTDLLADWRKTLALYGLPSAAIMASGAAPLSDPTRGAIWAFASLIMAGACLANALRCGRVHCWFTGPFLLLMALASALLGAGVGNLGPGGWGDLGLLLMIGAASLMFVPELILGKYRGRAAGRS